MVHSRASWGGRTPTGGSLGPVSVVAVHHTAAGNAPSGFDPARWRRLEAGEVANGYASLAYHFGVTHGGEQVEIRGWGQRGAATGGWNDRSVAIVYDGHFHPGVPGYTGEKPTGKALDAIADLIAQGVKRGAITDDFRVEAHRTLTAGTKWATACPGDLLFPHIKKIEADARSGGAQPELPSGDQMYCTIDGETHYYFHAGRPSGKRMRKATQAERFVNAKANVEATRISYQTYAWLNDDNYSG